jgi:hypothetical protein
VMVNIETAINRSLKLILIFLSYHETPCVYTDGADYV